MRDYAELIKALRCCGNDMECGSCPISTPESTSGDCDLMHMKAADAIEELSAELRDCKNELCLLCGRYKERHNGACSDCRWRPDNGA